MSGQLAKIEQKIDDLATMMAQGFYSINERFDRLEIRMDRAEDRLDRIEIRLGQMEVRLDKMEGSITRMEIRLDGLEGKMGQLERCYRVIQNTQEKHTVLLKRIVEDVDMLVSDDLAHERRIKTLEKDSKIFKKTLKLA